MLEGGSDALRSRLANSGVAWAPMTIAFGYDIARWLAEEHPRHAEIDSFDEDGASLPELLRHALPAMEFELVSRTRRMRTNSCAGQAAGTAAPGCSWLDRAFSALPCTDNIREHLFDSLKAFIRISPGATALSRTYARGPAERDPLPSRRASSAAATRARS